MRDAHGQSGLDQEGSVKSIKLWGRMLLSVNNWWRRRGLPDNCKYPRILDRGNDWDMQGDMSRWQHAGRFRRHHVLAAALAVVRGGARHGAAALHAFLIERERGHAVGKPE